MLSNHDRHVIAEKTIVIGRALSVPSHFLTGYLEREIGSTWERFARNAQENIKKQPLRSSNESE